MNCLPSILGLVLCGLLAVVFPARAGSPNDLVVHEWGTFTCHFGPDGVPVSWQPLQAPSDLPRFVRRASAGATKKNTIAGTVRMETPVLYFYSERRRSVSVEVGFPDGLITEWYPRVRPRAHGITWPRVTILPGASVSLPTEPSPSHYYPARETDAAIVRVGTERRAQYEKFLFYRGVGTFDLPVTAHREGDGVVVRNVSADPIDRIFLFEHRGDQTGYRAGSLSGGTTTLALPVAAAGAQAAFEADLRGVLVGEGLFAREADAMIATWRSTWTEDGLRVFYVVPRPQTDAVLPLDISPRPASVVRVLVGRGEVDPPTEPGAP